jgi:succinoglycan biosynthesis protein ExoA
MANFSFPKNTDRGSIASKESQSMELESIPASQGTSQQTKTASSDTPLATEFPFVTMILPIRNEVNHIERCIRSVLAQDYPKKRMELLVVDGMSDDGTRELLTKFGVRFLDNPKRIVPAALNIGLKEARGEIIVRVDGHCEISSDYVRKCVELLHKTGADCVGGLQKTIGTGYVDRAVALATSSPFGVGNAIFHYAKEPGWTDTVYLGAYPKVVFKRIDYFDEELVRNQDDEFNFRLKQSGGKIWLDPSIRSVYYARSSLYKLSRQYFEYGYYKVRVIQKRGAVPSLRHLVPAGFIVILSAAMILGLATGQFILPIILIGPYLVANVVSTIWTGRKDPAVLPLLPLIYATMHLSYGFGFLKGIWDWYWKGRFRKHTKP